MAFGGNVLLENQSGLLLEDDLTGLRLEAVPFIQPSPTDFIDYIFQFPDMGTWLRDPTIKAVAPSQPGVALLIYNPVETNSSPAITGNSLVLPPQQANSTVALPGFWVMITIKGSPISQLWTHPNLQILNDRTLMFARQPSVLLNNIDVSHINIVINNFGVYVADGLSLATTVNNALTDDAGGVLLLNDAGTSFLIAA